MNNESLPSVSGFSNVDSRADVSWYIDYLQKLYQEPLIKQYKEKSLAVLDPKPEDQILDVGCGLGFDVFAIYAYEQEVGRVIGIDYSEAMITQAISNTPQELIKSGKIVFQKEDAHRLSFYKNLFDATLSDRTFQHLKDPFKAFKEIVRVTKEGGRIVIADTDWGTLRFDGIDEEDSERVKSAYLAIIRNPRMGSSLEQLFLNQGLKNVEVYAEITRKSGFEGIQGTLGLESSFNRAQINGALSNEEANRLLGEMQREDREISASLTIYIVRGIKSSIV